MLREYERQRPSMLHWVTLCLIVLNLLFCLEIQREVRQTRYDWKNALQNSIAPFPAAVSGQMNAVNSALARLQNSVDTLDSLLKTANYSQTLSPATRPRRASPHR